MQINLNRNQIVEYAKLYPNGDDNLVRNCMTAAVKRGNMTLGDLLVVAKWKWKGGRTQQLCKHNTEVEVKEVSAVSFSSQCERLRIGALLALSGVQWPMASVILHFAFPDKYPILDVRAMRTVGGSTFYTFDKWIEYVDLCRGTAVKYGVTLRTLDKALWSFDKEKQKLASS